MKRLLMSALIFLGLPAQLMAIPAFARITGNSCAYCHALPSLQLTVEGIKFQHNGMRLAPLKFSKDDQSLTNYASLVLEYQVNAYRTTPQTSPSVQNSEPVFSVFTGGALANAWSYKAIYHFNASPDPTANLEEAYLQYNANLGGGALLAVRGGQFMPELLRNFGLGPSSYVETPLVLGTAVSANSPFTLATAMRGVDANLYWGGLEASAGVFDATTGSTTTNPTNHKDTYGSLLWRFDGMGSGAGYFRYDGVNMVFTTPGDPTTPLLYNDSFYRNGLLFRFVREKWRVMAAGFQGAHTMDTLGTRTKNRGWYGLVDLDFTERFGAFARYDQESPDLTDATRDTRMAVVGLNGFLFREAKSGGRWVLETSRTTSNGIKNYQTLLYVVMAF